MRHFAAPPFQATLQCPDLTIWIGARLLALQTLNNSRAVRHGSASNHSRNRAVTVRSGSGRRRPRLAFSFGLLVGRTSPSCHAVRRP